jgi:hypothetical protein
MTQGVHPVSIPSRTLLAGISATSAALLMTELALTRIFSVTMFYHFAFLAISIASGSPDSRRRISCAPEPCCTRSRRSPRWGCSCAFR